MSKIYTIDELQQRYGKSEKGNFFVRRTIGVPHAYCITPIHVEVADKHHGGILGRDAIEDAERAYGGYCGTCHGKFKFSQHETGLLVSCALDVKDDKGDVIPELKDYLTKNLLRCQEDGFAGFAFLRTLPINHD